MSIFNRNKFSEDDEKIVEIVIKYLEDKIILVNQECVFSNFEEWQKVMVYEESIWFYHKIHAQFGFMIYTDNNKLILRNHHRETFYRRMGDGNFMLNKLTQLFLEVSKIKKFAELDIVYEIWESQDESSESVRKLLLKNNYKKIQKRNPEEWIKVHSI